MDHVVIDKAMALHNI